MNAIINKLKEEAPFLDGYRNRLLLVSFLALFIFTFLVVYSPFNMNTWGSSIGVYVGIGVFVMLASQFVVRHFLGVKNLKWYQVILWFLGELFLISYLIYLIYSPEFDTSSEKLTEFILTLKFSFLVLVGPYVSMIWFLATRYEMASIHRNVEIENALPDELLTITGENNKVLLAVNYEQLVFVKSSGNYVNIYYLNGESVVKELIRLSLKELESTIVNPHVIRIHRSCMVNRRKIAAFKKERKGYKVNMQHIPEEILPVSLGYMKSFEEAMKI